MIGDLYDYDDVRSITATPDGRVRIRINDPSTSDLVSIADAILAEDHVPVEATLRYDGVVIVCEAVDEAHGETSSQRLYL